MQRWILNSVAVLMLAVPALLTHYGAMSGLGANREGISSTGMPEWLSLLVSAGAYVLQWGPVVCAALIFFYANRRRG